MGAWGPKLYQDDVAMDVKDYYKEQLHREKSGEEITQELIAQNEYTLSDPDDAPVFWFALADTQWDLGRLENFVKENALHHIREGHNIKHWELKDPKEAKTRAKVLFNLEQKLLSSQPAEKRVSKYKLYHCEWMFGDVYAYPLDSDYAKEKGLNGKYFLFHKIDEGIWHPGHTVPIVRMKITEDEKFPNNVDEFNKLEYIQTSVTKYEEKSWLIDSTATLEDQMQENIRLKSLIDEDGLLKHYRIKLINTSKRIIPSKLVYVGNFRNIDPPRKEFVPHSKLSIPNVIWKFFDKIMIDRYCGYNLR